MTTAPRTERAAQVPGVPGRGRVRVRPAVASDLDVLVELGAELAGPLLLVDTGRDRREVLRERLVGAVEDPAREVLLATDADGAGLGLAVLVLAPVSALGEGEAVHVSHVVVPQRHRRRGVGRALVAAAAAYAEERGAEQVVVSLLPGSRDAQRFFARLGFAPLSVRRAAAVSVLRRRLAGEHGESVRSRDRLAVVGLSGRRARGR